MKNKFFILFISIIVFLIVISISIVIFSNTNKEKVNDKIDQEINYIETKLLGMINSLNNITFSNSVLLEQNTIKDQQDSNASNGESKENNSNNTLQQDSENNEQNEQGNSNNQSSGSTDYTKYNVENRNILIQEDKPIDWSYLKNNVEVLYSTWPTIMIDLHSINVKNEDILAFSNTLDTLVINIQKEDKKASLRDLATLYSLLPVYLQQYSDDSDRINIFYTKSYVINGYVVLEEDNWQEIQNQINKAAEFFSIIINSVDEKRQQSAISRVYIALNEMKNVITLKDRKLFYLKYINLMESALEI